MSPSGLQPAPQLGQLCIPFDMGAYTFLQLNISLNQVLRGRFAWDWEFAAQYHWGITSVLDFLMQELEREWQHTTRRWCLVHDWEGLRTPASRGRVPVGGVAIDCAPVIAPSRWPPSHPRVIPGPGAGLGWAPSMRRNNINLYSASPHHQKFLDPPKGRQRL
jgi:hypothetical protein